MQNRRPNRIGPAKRFRFRSGGGGGTPVTPPPPPPPPPSTPSVSLTAPTSGGTSTSVPVTVSATATANSPATSITQVEFFAGGSSIGVDSAAPFAVAWSPDNGTYTLQARATDNLGGTALSTTLSHTVTVSPPAGTTLTTLAISNESSSASVPPNSITQMFGHAFKKADIPTGYYPQLQLTDGTAVAANIMQPAYWPDGSMRFASFLARIPVGITAKMRIFTSSGSTITLANQTDLATGDACILGSTDRLPAGLDPTKIYYVRLGAANTATFHPTASDAAGNTNAVTTSGSGAGTHRLEPAVVVAVKNGGSAPAAASVSNSTITSNSDLKVTLDALLGSAWSGTQTSSVNTGISDGGTEITTFGDGPVGRVIRVYQEFNDGSSDHAQAGAFHYVQCLQNAGGGLYGLRYWPALMNGWHDVSSATYPIDSLACDNIVAKDGSTTVANPGTGLPSHTFTWSSGAIFNVSPSFRQTVGSTGESDEPTFIPVKLTTTGALPTGLDAATTYWLRQYNTTFGGSQFRLFPTAADAYLGTNAVTASGAGSGTHTLAQKPWIQWYSAFKPVVGSSAKYTYVQGTAGTIASDATIRVTQNRPYMLATKVLPSYRFDDTVRAQFQQNASRSYALETMDDIQYPDQTGPTPTIGQITGHQYRHLVLNEYEQTMRVYSATQHHRTWSVMRDATKNPINVTPDARANLGTAVPEYSLRPSNTAANNGVNAPTNYVSSFMVWTWDHRPGIQGYSYLMFGEPQMFDMMMACAQAGLCCIYGGAGETYRKQVVGVTTYYNTLQSEAYERETGWRLRDLSHSAMFASTSWNGADFSDYFYDIIKNEHDFAAAYIAAGSTFAKSIKLPVQTASGGQLMFPWGHGFIVGAQLHAYVATEYVPIRNDIENYFSFLDNVEATWGMNYVDPFWFLYSKNNANLTSWDQAAASTAFGDISWDATTDVITITDDTTVLGFGAIANGVNFINWGHKGTIGGVTNGTPYYVRDWNAVAKTFKLSTNSGLTDTVDITNTGAITDETGLGGVRTGGGTSFGSAKNETSISSNIVGYTRYAAAVGVTLPTGWKTMVEADYGADPTYAANPTYAFKDSYTYT